MPGLDVSQVSSNWRKLKEQLKTAPKQDALGNGSKRKRAENPVVSGPRKRARLSKSQTEASVKRRQMGVQASKPTTIVNEHADLVQQHDIAPEDVSAAYSITNGISQDHEDEINAGLHPTHKAGKYIALDTEMVGVGPPPYSDDLVARVSLVNFYGEQLYDSYVQPPSDEKIGDYRTPYSGITAAHLEEDNARPFAEVQRDVAHLLEGRVLVGHAVKNDLHVLMLSHPKRDVRDTSRYPKFRVESKGKPPALRNLAKAELGMRIQSGEHSSIEDARAAMMLFKKEKAGFEEENRKHFGRHTKLDVKRGQNVETSGPLNGFGEDNSDDEEEIETLDGEEDDLEDAHVPTNETAALKAKKRKKKKRTKRK